jgi:hypothetical protein
MRPLHSIIIVALTFMSFVLTSCEDPLPEDYVRELVVEGFVVTDRPLTGIRIYASQPITEFFDLRKAMIKDAEVVITENGTPIDVQFVDTSYRVKANTTYTISVRAIGFNATATAQTMPRFEWTMTPKDKFQYPGKEGETKRYDSLDIAWTAVKGVSLYVIGMSCLDTLNYGIYLESPTSELNRRIRDSEFDEDFLIDKEPSRYGAVIGTKSPVVWTIFRWFGPHRIHVYAGDAAFQKWFQQVGFGGRSTYDYRLGNMKGALGVFAGATELTAPIFLVKDKP